MYAKLETGKDGIRSQLHDCGLLSGHTKAALTADSCFISRALRAAGTICENEIGHPATHYEVVFPHFIQTAAGVHYRIAPFLVVEDKVYDFQSLFVWKFKVFCPCEWGMEVQGNAFECRI